MIDEKIIAALREAYFCTTLSTDSSTKVGAVLLDPITKKPLTWGVNSFTNYSQQLDSRNYERPRKYKVTEHAERAVIFRAAKYGIKTNGLILVATWCCCPDCARAIVLSGIKEVYCHKQAYDLTPERWKKDIDLGIEILKGSGVEYHLIDCVLNVKSLFNGEIHSL